MSPEELEAWQPSQSSTQRPRYVFTPYEPARLRKSTVEIIGGVNPTGFLFTGPDLGSSSIHQSSVNPHQSFLQSLIPSLEHIWMLVDYHEVYLLWYHCCYHGPTFRSELESVIAEQEDKSKLNITGVRLQWLALLFSIMAASLTCTSEQRLESWGFSKSEAGHLSIQWYKATITCLYQGEWTSDHDMYSVQAVTTLTMSAHSLGRSTELSVLLAAALKIAQVLGLDRLDHNQALEDIDTTSSQDKRHSLLIREVGRKLWSQLCMQDWMSLPFTGNYNINPAHFRTTKPSSRDHLTMEPLPTTFPTYISYGNYLFDIAKLGVRHHEANLKSTTPFTKYQHVLDYDSQMRDLATKGMPRYFHVMEPVDTLWPQWVHWARSSLTVCFAHKIIMIHRAYIRQSFTESAYSRTRTTCIAAAKTILNETKKADAIDGPIIWIDKAFCIAAGIILCLDISHRSESDPEYINHKGLVVGCIAHLRKFENSVIATRGASLLTEILDEPHRPGFVPEKTWPNLNVSDMVGSNSNMDKSPAFTGPEYQASGDLFPAQAGFSNQFLFENLLCRDPTMT
ncbi:hypothetical protein LTR84_005754 [Exophiala bonariae]|uniref:Transcription factor domain-containing protein n=1 Tax=Exophiala bonariae TaxID=1690606 RepID=A0AAV9N384_9EURO|nr:hypothetical protein LTR84_005754 [Exophiala bonariae]